MIPRRAAPGQALVPDIFRPYKLPAVASPPH